MKPEYEEFLRELIEKRLSGYDVSCRDTVRKDIPTVLRGQCESFVRQFVEKFPHLKSQMGFYGSSEHIWCVDIDGTIIDPTRGQYWYKAEYRIFNPEEDIIKIGKCPNCGSDIYGLIKNAPQDFCDEDCSKDYENYINREVLQYRSGR